MFIDCPLVCFSIQSYICSCIRTNERTFLHEMCKLKKNYLSRNLSHFFHYPGQKSWAKFALLVLLHTRQPRIQLLLPSLIPTSHHDTMLKTSTYNFP